MRTYELSWKFHSPEPIDLDSLEDRVLTEDYLGRLLQGHPGCVEDSPELFEVREDVGGFGGEGTRGYGYGIPRKWGRVELRKLGDRLLRLAEEERKP